MALKTFFRRLGTTILFVLVNVTLAIIIGVSGAAFLIYVKVVQPRWAGGPAQVFAQPTVLMVVICITSVLLGVVLGSQFLGGGARQQTSKGGQKPMAVPKPTETQDAGVMKAERGDYYRKLVAATDQLDAMRQQVEVLRRDQVAAFDQLNQIKATTVGRDRFEQLRQQFDDLMAKLDRSKAQAQSDQQDLMRLRQENGRLANDLGNLRWQLTKAQEQVQTLMQQDMTRQRENDRLRERLTQLQQGGTGPLAGGKAEFEEPQAGDPPDYEKEKGEHNHRKVVPDAGSSIVLADSWRLIGASRRGRGHEYKHVYRDDDFEARPFAENRGVVVAIADGLGSKPFSRWGARAAVVGAVKTPQEARLKQLADDVATLARPAAKQPLTDAQRNDLANRRDSDARGLVIDLLNGARTLVSDISHQRGKSYDELHSTLLVFIAIPYNQGGMQGGMYIASAQVGDGALRSRGATAEGPQWLLEEQPQLNGVDNEVQPFMRVSPDRYSEFVHTYDREAVSFVVGMTDGTLDDIEGGPDENGVFKNIEDFYQRINKASLTTSQPAAGLFDFLGYRRRASFDDRTLVCLYRQP